MSAGSQAARAVTAQGHYAGSMSRLLGYGIDLLVSSGLFSLALAAISYVAKIVSGHEVSWGRDNIVCLLYTSPSPRDRQKSRMPSSA